MSKDFLLVSIVAVARCLCFPWSESEPCENAFLRLHHAIQENIGIVAKRPCGVVFEFFLGELFQVSRSLVIIRGDTPKVRTPTSHHQNGQCDEWQVASLHEPTAFLYLLFPLIDQVALCHALFLGPL